MMPRRHRLNLAVTAISIAACAIGADVAVRTGPHRVEVPRPFSSAARFEPNQGQFPAGVRFVGRGAGADVMLTDRSATFFHAGHQSDGGACLASIEMSFGALSSPRPSDRLPSVSNFFLGSDPARWRTSVPNYARVSFDGSSGERIVFHGSPSGDVEYDLELPAAVDASTLTMTVANAELTLRDGDLVAHTECGDFVQPRPRAFQSGTELRAEFVLRGSNTFGVMVPKRGTGGLLVDPTIVYSMTLPGTDVTGGFVAIDAAGHLYFATGVNSVNYPVKDALQSSMSGFADVGITKFSADGSALVWSTYLGGSAGDGPTAIAVDGSENVYIGGSTGSLDFPTKNALKSTATAQYEGFVTKFESSGASLAYSTYIGASSFATVSGLAVDATGAVTIAGRTSDIDFPVTGGAFQSTFKGGQTDSFAMRLAPSGSAVEYSTYVGGSDTDYPFAMAIGSDGAAMIAGITYSSDFPIKNAMQSVFGGVYDGFIVRLPPSGIGASYSTYLGGSGLDRINGVVVDNGGNAIVVGSTDSPNFPTLGGLGIARSGPYDAFVTKVGPTGTASASTLLGGNASDVATSVALRSDGQIVVVGSTTSTNYPLISPMQVSSMSSDAFIARLDPSLGSLTMSTYFGGVGWDQATSVVVDGSGTVYLSGLSYLAFPEKNSLFNNISSGSWIAKLAPMSLLPPEANVAPLASVLFTTTEGAGSYVYSFATNASGGSISPSTGAYVAGATGSTIDVIKVTDSSGLTSTATINVGPGVSILPVSATPAPKAPIAFTATGGSGTGFTWALPSNNSGATLNPSSGAYVAGSTASVTDVVTVTDSLGNIASRNVYVGPGVSIAPTAPSVPPKGTVNFTATGGTGQSFVWTLTTNASGATLGPSGVYQAGSIAKVVDTVSVSDSLGNGVSVNVSVGGGLAVNPPAPKVPPRGSIAFVGSGGGAGYSWSLVTNASGGTIDPSSGAYVAGETGNTSDVIELSDNLGNKTSTTVVVGPGITISPPLANVPRNTTIKLFASGGAGHDYAWEILVNGSGGSIDASTGLYVSGPNGGSVDRIRVHDPLGNRAELLVLVDAVVLPDAGADAPSAPTLPPPPSGCSCDLAREGQPSSAVLGMAIALSLVLASRRRARAASPPP